MNFELWKNAVDWALQTKQKKSKYVDDGSYAVEVRQKPSVGVHTTQAAGQQEMAAKKLKQRLRVAQNGQKS